MSLFRGERVFPDAVQFFPAGQQPALLTEGAMWYDNVGKQYLAIVNGIAAPIATGLGGILGANNTWTGTNTFTAATTLSAAATFTSTASVQAATAATSGSNKSSPVFSVQGAFWNGSASVNDPWNVQTIEGAGTNPFSELKISNTTSTHPQILVSLPNDPGGTGAGGSFVINANYPNALAFSANGLVVTVTASNTGSKLVQGLFLNCNITNTGTITTGGLTSFDLNAAASPAGSMSAGAPVNGVALQNSNNGAGTIAVSNGYLASQFAASGGTVTTYTDFYGQAGSISSSSTVTNYQHFRCDPPTLASGGTVGNLYGLYVKAQGGIATTFSAGVYLETAGAGANDYALYSAGGKLFLNGTVSQYNGSATQGVGIPSLVYSNNQTGQTANLNAGAAITTVTPTVNSVYRVSVTMQETTAATTSSTTPSVTLGWTDAGGIARTLALVATNSGNVTTFFSSALQPIFTNNSTPVTVTYAGYASSGATAMQYATSIQVEQIG